MDCESLKSKLDTYLDGEFPAEEMRALDAHVHSCPSCSADALMRLQLKRAVHAGGQRFTPSADFRRRIQQSVTTKPRHHLNFRWMPAAALALLVIVALLSTFLIERSRREKTYGEIADLHVAALASSSRVDVISTDRHTVKPWFQGKIPFTFDLPNLPDSEFSLLGGRVAYLDQSPGAHLIYEIRKHEISVFIFQDAALHANWNKTPYAKKELSFNMESWSQGGLRYCVVGDASATDIDTLADLLKRAAGS